MERTFEKSLCLGTGIPFAALIFMISIPNAMILVTLYRNPLRCFRKTFTVFLAFITATDLFVGSVVCTGLAITRFLCSLRGKQFPGEGDIPTILGYIGINSSILMVTAMSVDRLVSVVCPHFYLNTVKPKTLPYFASILVEANCSGCRGKKWLIVLRESSVVFLFLNSTVNPLLTTFRINELKHSLRIVIRVQRKEDVSSFGSSVQQKTMRNTASV